MQSTLFSIGWWSRWRLRMEKSSFDRLWICRPSSGCWTKSERINGGRSLCGSLDFHKSRSNPSLIEQKSIEGRTIFSGLSGGVPVLYGVSLDAVKFTKSDYVLVKAACGNIVKDEDLVTNILIDLANQLEGLPKCVIGKGEPMMD